MIKPLTIIIIEVLLWATTLSGQSVYCFVGNHFCTFDLTTEEQDTLISFSDYPTGWGFRCAIDRYNGRYFFGGTLPGFDGNFHIINLVTLEIQSGYLWPRPENMEYDFIRDRIVFERNGILYAFPLNTGQLDSVEVHMLATIENGNSNIWGQKRTYIPQTDQFIYVDFIHGSQGDPYYLVIDAQTGMIVCQELIETYQNNFYYPAGFVTNNLTGEVIAHHEGRFGIVDGCAATLTKQTQVTGYSSHLNSQMAMFNHQNHTYIIPFINGSHPNYNYLMGIVDVEADQLLEIRDQPFDGAMNLQQIYDKPIAPIIHLRDTLFVPMGDHYEWFVDGKFVAETETNYFIPVKSGTYTAYVLFKEYATYSTAVEIVLSSDKNALINPDIEIYPNPVLDYLYIDHYDGLIQAVHVLDIAGRIVCSLNQMPEIPARIEIDLSALTQGVYTVSIHANDRYLSRPVVRM